MPSQVRIIVRTRRTDAETTGFQVVSETAMRVARPVSQNFSSTVTSKSGSAGAADESALFSVDAVLHNASQESVYSVAVSDLTEAALLGVNCTLLCYGQSGAGKSFTVFGGDSYPTRGCAPRALQELFDAIGSSTERDFAVRLSVVEVRQEQVYDLLGAGPARAAAAMMDGHGAVVLRGVEERACATEAEALAAVFEGQQRRLAGATATSPNRSRSHVVVTVYIESKSLVDSDALTLHSRLTFVDLAGSERLHESAGGSQEAQMINRSLTMLEQVILALASNRQRHVPYRQSKLTMLLKNAIGGTSKTTLIANVWPETRHTESTLATLNFAKRMMRVESVPSVQSTMDPGAQIKLLQKEVISLKSELRMQEQLAGREAVLGAPFDSEELSSARERVETFVDGSVSQMRLSGVRDMQACFSVFKSLVLERDARVLELERQLQSSALSRPSSSANNPSSGTRGGNAARQSNTRVSPAASADTKVARNRCVSSVEDPSAGVGIGRTEHPNVVLKDTFQRPLSDSKSPNTVVVPTANECLRETTAPPPQQQQQQQLQMQQQQQQQQQQQTPMATAAVPAAASVMPRDRGILYSSPIHAQTQPQASAARNTNASPVVPPPPRDKRAAFDLYKRSPAGAAQIVAIAEAQRLVAEKSEAVVRLQRRAEELRTHIGNAESGNANRLADTITSSNGNNPTQSVGSNASDRATEEGGGMSVAECFALARHTHSAATRATTERAILIKQLNRKREAFMSNFEVWFRTRTQPPPSQQQSAFLPAVPGSTKGPQAPQESAAHVALLSPEADMRFMDSAERFEATEMQRRVQEDPQSATFYAAQRLVRRKPGSRGGA